MGGGQPKANDRGDRLGDKRKQIKPVLYADQVELLERALRKTEKMNRGEALMEICRAYLGEKG